MNSEYQTSLNKKIDKVNVQNVEDIKKFNECKIHTGWKQEWVSPKRLNDKNPMKIREVVRGPFYSPKLLKITPFVSYSFDKHSCDATRCMKKTYGGIPDPWTECLAIKGYCNNDKYSKALKSSCVSSCMRFWVTKAVWTKMGLPLIQGIPDPDKDFCNILKPCSKCPSKQRKCRNFQALPRSKSLSNHLDKNIAPENVISSNVSSFTNVIVTNNEKTIKSTKSSPKQFKRLDEEAPITKNRGKHCKNNSSRKKSGDDIYINSKDNKLLSSKGNKKEDNLTNKTKDARSNQEYFHSSINVGTQTSLDKFHRVSCKDSSFQTLLKIARKSILGRKAYKSLKERWARTRGSNIFFEHENQYFSNPVTPCHCKKAVKDDISIKIEKELSDKLSTNRVVNNYCASCKEYFLKMETIGYPCHESVRDRRRRKRRENTKRMSHSLSQDFGEKNQKLVREDAMIQTELKMQGASAKELRLICSRCNYPYFKVETENRINASTHRLDDRKDYAFIRNTHELNHRFQGKCNDGKQSTIPASRSISKQDDLNFTCLREYGCIQNARKNDRKETRRNAKKMNCMTEKIKEIYDIDRVKEKILDFPMEHKELVVEDNSQYANISEQSKYNNSGELSSATSNCYLGHKTITKDTNVNKLEAISTDQNTCRKSQLLTSNCDKKTFSKADYSKIKDKSEEILSGAAISSTIKKGYNKNEESKNLIDYAKPSVGLLSRTDSKTKSKIKSKQEFLVNRKSKGKSKVKLKSKVKSTYNKSKLDVNSKFNDESQFGAQSKSNGKPKSRSRSTFKSEFNNKSRSKSRSKSKSKSRSTYVPNSKSKYIQTESKIPSLRSLKNLSNNIPERENENENDRSSLIEKSRNCYRKECTKCTDCHSISNHSINIEESQLIKSSDLRENPQINEKIENKDATSSTIGFIFNPGPCVNRNNAIERKTCDEIIDSSDSIYSSMTNFDQDKLNESRKFPLKTNCWFSKSDNYINSNQEEEKRKKDFLCRKENDCYLKFCNSRYFSGALSLNDE
ncbi:hypothetical protein M0802_005468 [Mischocyttarus mexicanus]|nr:hypothetical protein M0802_005468 [Mischocyttarus mexicanus]